MTFRKAALALILSGALAPAFAAGNARFVNVIVSLKAPAGRAAAANRMAAADFARHNGFQPTHTYGAVFSGFSASIPEGRLNGLRHNPRVLSVSFDGEMHTFKSCHATQTCGGGGGGSTGQTVPWGISRIGADGNSNTGAGIDVFVIDTGIDADHPDLAAHIGDGYAVETCKGGSCAADWDDDEGHGTHVSGTIGAIDNNIDVVGVAPGVTLHAVKVLNKRGSGSTSNIITGIDWVAQYAQNIGKPVVANMSLGGSGSKTGTCTSSGFTGSDNFHRAICNAKNAGVVFAIAAGNSGADAATSTPAAYDDAVITVSATSNADDWPYWSNYGTQSASWTSHNSAPVAIAAPGVDILSLLKGGGTTTMSGTSMATPHVAGAIALYLASHPQAEDGSAFANTRQALLQADESTAGFANTSGNPHDEDFLDASGL
ncbi:MAG: S8 family serine peptidase [Gammaproteobacteria bacterium]|jgi:subtilisin